MYTQAATFKVLGYTVYTYGLFLSIACFLAGGLLLYRTKSPRSRDTATLTFLFSPVIGLVTARFVYIVFEVNFAPFFTLGNVINLHLGGFSMYGALIGAILGSLISASLTGEGKSQSLDMLIPSLFLFICVARLGEQYTTLGISRPLVTGVLDSSFLALKDEYDAYLRTYLLESTAAFILCIVTISYAKKPRKTGRVFLFGALLFGVSQTFFESLRFDAHIRFSFISLHQVLSATLFSAVLIYLAISLMREGVIKKRLAILTLCLLPVILGAIIAIEFMIDRSQINKWLSYAVYAAVLLVPSILGLSMLKQERV